MPKRAVSDFLNERWGKFQSGPQNNNIQQRTQANPKEFKGASILVLPLGSETEIARMVDSLRAANGDNVRLTLLVQSFRRHLFADLPLDEFILFDPATQNAITENLRTLAKVHKGHFDVAVTADQEKLTPFSFAVPKAYYYDNSQKNWGPLNEGLKQIWRLAYAFLAGEFMVWALLPFVYRKARVYQNQ